MLWGCIIKKLIIIFALIIASALYAETDVDVQFHGFPWGTSIEAFKAKMGNPAFVDEIDGLQSLVYDKLIVSGYPVFMLVYFSKNGLEGGTYYFNTNNLDELMKCYTTVQKELLEKFGPTDLCDGIIKEMRPYETSWKNLNNGYVYLKVNTRQNEPVTLWYSSPALTEKLTSPR
jgi:hypothetical protein